ncbi:MAG: phospholipid carrier-dependent glycosyltransferase [Planctomycetota bacterium]
MDATLPEPASGDTPAAAGGRLARFSETLLILSFAFPILLFAHALSQAPVGVDAGYFLGSVERMADGAVFYRDLGVGYTPLALYAFYGVRLLVGPHAAFGAYLGLVFLVEALCALLAYFLARRIAGSRLVALGAALLAWLLFYFYDGTVIVLEPFTALFALLAAAACFAAPLRQAQDPEKTRGAAPWALFAAGAAAGAAFLSKQFGLAVLPPVALFAFLSGDSAAGRIRNVLRALAGFALPLALFFGIHSAFCGTGPGALAAALSGSGYGRLGFGQAFEAFGRFLVQQNIFLLWCPILLLDRETRRDPRFWLVLSMAFLFGSALAVRAYLHYFLPIIPFTALLGVFAIAFGRRRPRLLPFVAGSAVLALLATLFISQDVARWNDRRWNRESQFGTASAINRILPRGTPAIALEGAEPFLWLCDLLPPIPRLGYAFPRDISRKDCLLVLDAAKGAVVIPRLLKPEDAWQSNLEAAGLRPAAEVAPGVEVWLKPALTPTPASGTPGTPTKGSARSGP